MAQEQDYITLVSRRESPLWVSLVCHGGDATYFQKALGWDYAMENYKYEKQTHQVAVSNAVKLQEQISQSASGLDFYKFYLSRCKSGCKELIDTATAVHRASADPTITSKEELFELIDSIFLRSLDLMPFLASLVLIQGRLEAELKEGLAEEFGVDPNDSKVTEFLSPELAMVATQQSNFQQEARKVLALASEFKEKYEGVRRYEELPATVRAKIQNHIFEYGWLGTFTFLNNPYTHEEIFERIRNAAQGEPSATLQGTIEREQRSIQQSDEAINGLHNRELKELLRLGREYMYWRFERVDVHFKAEVLGRWVEEQLAAHAGLSRDELVLLSYQELKEWATGDGKLPSREELSKRQERGVDYYVEDGVHSMKVAEPIEVEHDPEIRRQAFHGLTGTTACKGSAKGTVRIVYSAQDIDKIKEGDILVTTMTTPDLMLGIEKSAAIVTDEGGILSHAAIISRELNIPCIIGTDIATRALLDGDVVVVDAEKGEGILRVEKPAKPANGGD